MEELKRRILNEGRVIGNDILKVDSFLNHKIDSKLVDNVGAYFASKFEGVTKILTIEASGIAFAIGVANHFDYAPVVFAKKSSSKIVDMNNVYCEKINSFTKNICNDVIVDKRFLNENDKVLIVDDFMADGNASMGLINLCKQANATIVGVAIVIEKGFQGGRNRIESLGIRVESAAIIDHFDNGKVVIK